MDELMSDVMSIVSSVPLSDVHAKFLPSHVIATATTDTLTAVNTKDSSSSLPRSCAARDGACDAVHARFRSLVLTPAFPMHRS